LGKWVARVYQTDFETGDPFPVVALAVDISKEAQTINL
jgi:hypothetical protein